MDERVKVGITFLSLLAFSLSGLGCCMLMKMLHAFRTNIFGWGKLMGGKHRKKIKGNNSFMKYNLCNYGYPLYSLQVVHLPHWVLGRCKNYRTDLNRLNYKIYSTSFQNYSIFLHYISFLLAIIILNLRKKFLSSKSNLVTTYKSWE